MSADTITLNIHDSIKDERFQMNIYVQLSVGDLIEQITDDRGLPRYDFMGEPLGYELVRVSADQVLRRRDTFAEINPRHDEIFQLRGEEASLIKDIIDELLDEIKENILEEAFDKAREKLQRINRTGASNSEIDSAQRELQRAAARSPLSQEVSSADQTLTHQPDSADVTMQASDRQQRALEQTRDGKRGRGCLTIGLIGGVLLLAAAVFFVVLVIIPGLQTPTPAAPPPVATEEPVEPPQETEEPLEPTDPQPEVDACEDAASGERAFVDPERRVASVLMFNRGTCIWEPGAYALELVDGAPIQPAHMLDQQVPPGEFAEIVMDVPPEYFEDSRFSLYEFISPDGPIAEVVFDYVLEAVECDDFASVSAAFLDYDRDEAVFLLINKGDCQWDQGVYKLVFIEGDIIQPEQDLPFTIVPGSEVEIRMPIPPEYYEDDRISVYAMARNGQPFEEQAIIIQNLVD